MARELSARSGRLVIRSGARPVAARRHRHRAASVFADARVNTCRMLAMGTILPFPTDRARPRDPHVERVVSETQWIFVTTATDGSMSLTKTRSPRFLSPGRAYRSPPQGARSSVRSLLLYTFSHRSEAESPDGRTGTRRSA